MKMLLTAVRLSKGGTETTEGLDNELCFRKSTKDENTYRLRWIRVF
jgi:hypothetical protein